MAYVEFSFESANKHC